MAIRNLEYYEKLNYPFSVIEGEDRSYFIECSDLKGCLYTEDAIEKAINESIDVKKFD